MVLHFQLFIADFDLSVDHSCFLNVLAYFEGHLVLEQIQLFLKLDKLLLGQVQVVGHRFILPGGSVQPF